MLRFTTPMPRTAHLGLLPAPKPMASLATSRRGASAKAMPAASANSTGQPRRMASRSRGSAKPFGASSSHGTVPLNATRPLHPGAAQRAGGGHGLSQPLLAAVEAGPGLAQRFTGMIWLWKAAEKGGHRPKSLILGPELAPLGSRPRTPANSWRPGPHRGSRHPVGHALR